MSPVLRVNRVQQASVESEDPVETRDHVVHLVPTARQVKQALPVYQARVVTRVDKASLA